MAEGNPEEEEKLPPEVEELLRQGAKPEAKPELPPEAAPVVEAGVRKGIPREEMVSTLQRIIAMTPEEMVAERLQAVSRILDYLPDSPQKEALRGVMVRRTVKEVMEDPVSARAQKLMETLLPYILTMDMVERLTEALQRGRRGTSEDLERVLQKYMSPQQQGGVLPRLATEVEQTVTALSKVKEAMEKTGDLGKGSEWWVKLARDGLDVVKTAMEKVPRKKVTGAPA
jgi:hypothetical protein